MTTFDGTTKLIDGGALTIKETVTPAAGGSQWVDFFVQGARGGPIDASVSTDFLFAINLIKIDAPAILLSGFLLFTGDGDPIDSGLSPAGVYTVETNPMTGVGEVFGFLGFTPSVVASGFGVGFGLEPFGFIFDLRISDGSDLNGFHFSLRLA